MADPRGFLSIEPQTPRPVHQWIKDYGELYQPMPADSVRAQASRCMDCGVAFCHQGCRLGNAIPDWNELVHRDRWQVASAALHDMNNFPEFTGKTRPASCEASCVLSLGGSAVTIEDIEAAIVDRAWEMGWIRPTPPERETGKSVGIVGRGLAGLAAAQQLRRASHAISVYERDDRPGGLLLCPKVLRITPAHEEGGRRDWQIKTKAFVGDDRGRVKELHAVRVHQYFDEAGERQFEEVHGSELAFPCELVLLAIGFSGPEPGLVEALGLMLTEQGTIRCNHQYMTSQPGVFSAGDCRRGQSLVVWAIAEGREAARHLDQFLTGRPSPLRARDRSHAAVESVRPAAP
jgi:NADPH-dependent glutamate synthase beta subunit-like oxidoreductase